MSAKVSDGRPQGPTRRVHNPARPYDTTGDAHCVRENGYSRGGGGVDVGWGPLWPPVLTSTASDNGLIANENGLWSPVFTNNPIGRIAI
jgi:hypothetical protein